MLDKDVKPRHTPRQIADLLSYDAESGALTWKIDVGKRGRAGASAGYFDGRYKRVQIDGVVYMAHRLAWCIQTGYWPTMFIDHKDENKLNNRWTNLRSATSGDNQANRHNLSNNASGVKGVSWHKSRAKWYARVAHKGVTHVLWLFVNLEEAAKAVAAKREDLHKEFANHG